MFIALLAVLFIGLKMTHFIDWSWWLVLAPIYIGPVIFLTGVIILKALD